MEDTDKIAEVTRLLTQASEDWKTQTNETANAAMLACEQALRLLDGMGAGSTQARLRSAAWMQRAQILDTAGQPAEAVRCYDQAIAAISTESADDAPGLAAAYMNRGGAQQRVGTPESLAAAGTSFAEAIAHLERWPEPRPADVENTLGAAWMNAGVCHARVEDDATSIERAKHAFDQAIGVLMRAAEVEPLARRNLASAWGNRGVIMLQTSEWEEALRCFGETLTLLEALRADGGEAVTLEMASTQLNLAQAHAPAGSVEASLAAIRMALALTAAEESKNPHFCALGLRARHALCIVLAGQISVGQARSPEVVALVAEAGDLVEEGLALVNGWGERATWFADQALRLFEFGGWLYRTQQPQFLAEFTQEHLADDPRRAAVAATNVQLAREELRRHSFASLVGDEAEWLQEWTTLAEKLKALLAAPSQV